MNECNLSYDELMQIVKVFESSSEFNELHLKFGDIELDLRKHGTALTSADASALAACVSIPTMQFRPLERPTEKPWPMADAVISATEPSAIATDAFPSGAFIVKSPMVGIFYCAPEPGAPPFVTIGQRVTADTTACVIEVMKLMSSVQAGVAGIVTHVLVGDGDPVEFGQALVVIDPCH